MNVELEKFILENESKSWRPTGNVGNIWESDWPWAPVFRNFDNIKVESELEKLKYYFVPHREKDKINSYGHEGWEALTLHGLDYDKTEHFDRYGEVNDTKYRWTEVCDLCPYITEFIKSFPYDKFGRVRIMKLAPRGYIMPHTDGPGRIFGPLNFALTNPQGCRFIFKDYGVVPFMPGRGFMLDIGNEHIVVNQSNEDRYHIIIHGNVRHDIIPLIKHSIRQL